MLLLNIDREEGDINISLFLGEHVKEIYYLQPWNAKDFGIRSLADR